MSRRPRTIPELMRVFRVPVRDCFKHKHRGQISDVICPDCMCTRLWTRDYRNWINCSRCLTILFPDRSLTEPVLVAEIEVTRDMIDEYRPMRKVDR